MKRIRYTQKDTQLISGFYLVDKAYVNISIEEHIENISMKVKYFITTYVNGLKYGKQIVVDRSLAKAKKEAKKALKALGVKFYDEVRNRK